MNFRDYESADMYRHAALAASGVILVGSALRDISADRHRKRIERKLDRIDRQVDYVTERTREEDPDYPPEEF